MIGSKTNGNWTDVTSYLRNEIVFEGRNKDYGAYYVRQTYDRSLLLALLITTTFGILCATVPFIISRLHHGDVVPADGPHGTFHLKQYVEHWDKPHVLPPTPPTPPKPPIQSLPHSQPLITHLDSIPVIPTDHQLDTHPIGDPNPNPNPGTGTSPIDPGTGTGTTPLPTTPPPPILIAQIMPKFGGDLQGYIGKHLDLTRFDLQQSIQATIFVSFIVEADGSISNVELLHGVAGAPGLNEEAVNIVKNMPAWSAGMQNGHAVRVKLNLPIKISYE
jgi:protein TonB